MDLYKIAEDLENNGPRDVFPMLERFRNYLDRRDYIERSMLALVENEDLYLSELMFYPGEVRDLVGDVILGHTYHDGFQTHQSPEPAIREYRVNIAPVLDKPDAKVEWKSGRRVSRKEKIRNAMIKGKGYSVSEPIMYESDNNSFALPDAYKILKQGGVPIKRSVAKAKKSGGVRSYVEIPPWAGSENGEESEAAKKGRGRPRKAA